MRFGVYLGQILTSKSFKKDHFLYIFLKLPFFI